MTNLNSELKTSSLLIFNLPQSELTNQKIIDTGIIADAKQIFIDPISLISFTLIPGVVLNLKQIIAKENQRS